MVQVVQTRGVARRQVRDERLAAERHFLSVVQHLSIGCLFCLRAHGLERRHVLGHRHHPRAGQLFDQRVAFLVIAVRGFPSRNLDVGELEAQLLDRLSESPARSASYVASTRMLPCGVTMRKELSVRVPT